jgi:hypothetical protein
VSDCNGDYYSVVINNNINIIPKLIYDQHKANYINLHLKIILKSGLLLHILETKLVFDDYDRQHDDLYNNTSAGWIDTLLIEPVCTEPIHTYDNYSIVKVPPLLIEEPLQVESAIARFTKEEFRRIYNIFYLPCTSPIDPKPVKIKWIKEALILYQILALVQQKEILDRIGSNLNADRQGLGKIREIYR